jgi:hypothetical protein
MQLGLKQTIGRPALIECIDRCSSKGYVTSMTRREAARIIRLTIRLMPALVDEYEYLIYTLPSIKEHAQVQRYVPKALKYLQRLLEEWDRQPAVVDAFSVYQSIIIGDYVTAEIRSDLEKLGVHHIEVHKASLEVWSEQSNEQFFARLWECQGHNLGSQEIMKQVFRHRRFAYIKPIHVLQ